MTWVSIAETTFLVFGIILLVMSALYLIINLIDNEHIIAPITMFFAGVFMILLPTLDTIIYETSPSYNETITEESSEEPIKPFGEFNT